MFCANSNEFPTNWGRSFTKDHQDFFSDNLILGRDQSMYCRPRDWLVRLGDDECKCLHFKICFSKGQSFWFGG
jgi:hypothetical protein